jgi:hypothetical protein
MAVVAVVRNWKSMDTKPKTAVLGPSAASPTELICPTHAVSTSDMSGSASTAPSAGSAKLATCDNRTRTASATPARALFFDENRRRVERPFSQRRHPLPGGNTHKERYRGTLVNVGTTVGMAKRTCISVRSGISRSVSLTRTASSSSAGSTNVSMGGSMRAGTTSSGMVSGGACNSPSEIALSYTCCNVEFEPAAT